MFILKYPIYRKDRPLVILIPAGAICSVMKVSKFNTRVLIKHIDLLHGCTAHRVGMNELGEAAFNKEVIAECLRVREADNECI